LQAPAAEIDWTSTTIPELDEIVHRSFRSAAGKNPAQKHIACLGILTSTWSRLRDIGSAGSLRTLLALSFE
jgi:hypothetical protein